MITLRMVARESCQDALCSNYRSLNMLRRFDYSQVPNNRLHACSFLKNFPTPRSYSNPPFINFWKNEMILDIISE